MGHPFFVSIVTFLLQMLLTCRRPAPTGPARPCRADALANDRVRLVTFTLYAP
jgi:hypothetical protein